MTVANYLQPKLDPRLDAGETVFLARELEVISSKNYERKYTELKARKHFPVSFEGGNGAATITSRYYDRKGRAQLGLGFPRVSVTRAEMTTTVRSITDSYGYDFQEVRNARQAGVPLEQAEASAARRAIAEEENRLAYVGDADTGLLGAFTHPNTPIQVAAFPINGNTDYNQVQTVFNNAINGIMNLSKGIAKANTILMSVDDYTWIASTVRNANTDTTMLELLKKSHPGVEFDWCVEAANASSIGKAVLFAYVRDEEYVVMRVPSDYEELPPFWDGVATTVNCHERFAGIEWHYAGSVLVELP
jgi:hypothetical protein